MYTCNKVSTNYLTIILPLSNRKCVPTISTVSTDSYWKLTESLYTINNFDLISGDTF